MELHVKLIQLTFGVRDNIEPQLCSFSSREHVIICSLLTCLEDCEGEDFKCSVHPTANLRVAVLKTEKLQREMTTRDR